MYELNHEIAYFIDQIDGAKVTNKGQYIMKPHCDIDFTYDGKFFHIDLIQDEEVEFDGFSATVDFDEVLKKNKSN